MRLTQELPMGSYTAKEIYLEPNRNEQECVYKLGQLEDIEEELGIDLITLINIFDKGFYALIKDDDHEEYYIFHFDARDIELCIDGKSLIVYEEWSEAIYGEYEFKDYGKTWALTKKELV